MYYNKFLYRSCLHFLYFLYFFLINKTQFDALYSMIIKYHKCFKKGKKEKI